MEKLTKTEARWRWIVGRLWGSHGMGWAMPLGRATKADLAMLERRIKAGHVERDEFGGCRMTDLGREAIGLEPISGAAGRAALAKEQSNGEA